MKLMSEPRLGFVFGIFPRKSGKLFFLFKQVEAGNVLNLHGVIPEAAELKSQSRRSIKMTLRHIWDVLRAVSAVSYLQAGS